MSYEWSIQAAGGSAVATTTTIDQSGNVKIGWTQNTATLYVKAKDSETGLTGSATLKVTNSPLEIQANNTSVSTGNNVQCKLIRPADSKQVPNNEVKWSVSKGTANVASGTTINSSGLLTIASNQSNGTIIVNAKIESITKTLTITVTGGTPLVTLSKTTGYNGDALTASAS